MTDESFNIRFGLALGLLLDSYPGDNIYQALENVKAQQTGLPCETNWDIYKMILRHLRLRGHHEDRTDKASDLGDSL